MNTVRTCEYSSEKTEHTGHALETEIVAEVFPPVAEHNTEYNIASYSALKIFVNVKYTLLNTDMISMIECWFLQLTKEIKLWTKF